MCAGQVKRFQEFELSASLSPQTPDSAQLKLTTAKSFQDAAAAASYESGITVIKADLFVQMRDLHLCAMKKEKGKGTGEKVKEENAY